MSAPTEDTNQTAEQVNGEPPPPTTAEELEAELKKVATPTTPQKDLIGLKPYDPRPQHDAARRNIAYWLLLLLTTLISCAFVGFGVLLYVSDTKPTFAEFKSLFELILTPLLTLVSAATGFYFGSQNQPSDRSST